MNVLIIDADSACVDFALRCKAAGHNVKAFVRQTKEGRNRVGDGLFEKVSSWEPHMKWADLVFVTDNIYYIHALDRYITQGYPILGPGVDAIRWEMDRKFGMGVMKKVGIETIPDYEFTKVDEAIAFVKKTQGRYVSKPNDEANKAMSYVSKGPRDLDFMLRYWKKEGKIKDSFILQEFTPGIEVAVGGWMGPGGFNKMFCENWEHKKLMNREIGPNTGEMGTVLHYTSESKLADQMLKPMEGLLHGLNYTGYIDINCIIDKHGQAWPLEWTMRPGWPLFQIQQAVHKGDPVEWMVSLIEGRDTLITSSNVAVGVAMAQPDFPYGKLPISEVTGFPIYGVTPEEALGDYHMYEVMQGKGEEADCFVSAGRFLLVVTGTGKTVHKAAHKAYKNLEQVELCNSPMYRTDIGERLEEQLPELHKHGFCLDIEYSEGEEDDN